MRREVYKILREMASKAVDYELEDEYNCAETELKNCKKLISAIRYSSFCARDRQMLGHIHAMFE